MVQNPKLGEPFVPFKISIQDFCMILVIKLQYKSKLTTILSVFSSEFSFIVSFMLETKFIQSDARTHLNAKFRETLSE